MVTFIVMSGIGYSYFSGTVFTYSNKVNLEVLFGIGIGVGLMLLMLIWLFFLLPKLLVNYILTFPLLVVMCSLYIVYTQPSEVTRYLKYCSLLWTGSITAIEFQKRYKCCGFYNHTDRGMSNCPITYESGCMKFVAFYLEPRFNELFSSAIYVLFVATISVATLLVLFCFSSDDSILEMFPF